MNLKSIIKRALRILPDGAYLRLRYYLMFHKPLQLANPQTFNEKIQWLKLHDRKPEYTRMVDKYEAKQYVTEKIGGEYVIPALGVWNHFDEIDFDALPERFVLKCTHDSGGLVICKDKASLDKAAAKKKIEACLKENYYWDYREWPYKNVKPRIIAEESMEDRETGDLRAYKFFAFNGVPRALYVATERQNAETETRFDFFDMEYRHLDLQNSHPNADVPPQKPEHFDTMKYLAGVLSRNIPQVRVDFYEVNGRVYFGELTFSHMGGLQPFKPERWDKIFGDWITLPERK